MEETQTSNQLIDISVPVYAGMVCWPGDPPVETEFALSIERGDACNVTRLSLGAHIGTHMDAPLHFVQGGQSIDQMPLAATIGPVRVIEVMDPESLKQAELQTHAIQPGERLLFKTRNSARCWQNETFVKDFVFIAPDAAQYLAERQVQTVGIDYLSVGGYFWGGSETHHALLDAGIWVIEGLNLAQVQPGNYHLICLPLKLLGREGAPARAILQTL